MSTNDSKQTAALLDAVFNHYIRRANQFFTHVDSCGECKTDEGPFCEEGQRRRIALDKALTGYFEELKKAFG